MISSQESAKHEKVNLMDGNMRRLPSWMLTGASSDVPVKSNRSENKGVEVKRKHEPEEAPKVKAEKRPRRIVKPQKETAVSEEPKKVGITRIRQEDAKPTTDVGKSTDIIKFVTGPKDEEDFTVDDLLSFAHEYVKGVEDQTIKDRESLSISESMVVVDESNNMSLSSQGGTIETSNSGADDMLTLLLGPFYKKSQQ